MKVTMAMNLSDGPLYQCSAFLDRDSGKIDIPPAHPINIINKKNAMIKLKAFFIGISPFVIKHYILSSLSFYLIIQN